MRRHICPKCGEPTLELEYEQSQLARRSSYIKGFTEAARIAEAAGSGAIAEVIRQHCAKLTETPRPMKPGDIVERTEGMPGQESALAIVTAVRGGEVDIRARVYGQGPFFDKTMLKDAVWLAKLDRHPESLIKVLQDEWKRIQRG